MKNTMYIILSSVLILVGVGISISNFSNWETFDTSELWALFWLQVVAYGSAGLTIKGLDD